MSVTFDDLIDEVAATMRGYGLVTPRQSYLSSDLDSSSTTITVADGSQFSMGEAEIGNEIVSILSVDPDTNTLTLFPDGRGWDSTTASAWPANTRVVMAPVVPKWRIANAVNDTIRQTYPDLFGVGSASFTFNPAVTTYALPAEAQDVLRVTADTIGPSKDDAEINRYSFNGSAPVDKWTTGKTITLREGPVPGRTVTVYYMMEPTEITWGDDLTVSGLRDTARRLVLYGALEQIMATIDPSRALTDSAVELEYSLTKNVIGVASQLAAQIHARYQMELATEERRLRSDFPLRIRISKR